jgi:hypothetical protein
VTALVTATLGYPPGDALRALLAQAAGNPLYVRELIDALLRERAIEIGSVADVSVSEGPLPASLGAPRGALLYPPRSGEGMEVR